VPEQLARGAAHLVGAVGDHARHADAALHRLDPLRAPALVGVAARLRQRPPGHEHARAGVEPRRDRLAEAVVGAARVAHGGEALGEALLRAAERLGRDQARRVQAVLLGDVGLDGADVDVGVGEAGHERAALAVDRVDAPLEGPHLAGADDVLDEVALDHHGGAVDGLLAGAVDEERIGEHGDAGHGLNPPDASDRRLSRRRF
jgi:hypothetical protein